VASNDPAEPRSTLTVTGQIKIEVDVVPSGIYFGMLHAGQTVERSVVIKPVEVKTFQILEVTSSDPAVVISKPVPAGPPEMEGSYRITITVGPLTEAKRVAAKVMVTTDLAHQKQIAIAVYGRAAEATAPAAVPQEAPGGAAAKS